MKKIILILFLFSNSFVYSQSGWIQQYSGTNNDLRSVTFLNSNTGTAVGLFGTILHTTNGGINWISQNSGTSEYLNSVFFINTNIGTAVGNNGVIIHTTNGGINWISQNSGVTYELNGVYLVDTNVGTIFSSFGSGILHTTNGGTNWVVQSNISNKYAVYFNDVNTGTTVGDFILHTTNGGINWAFQNNSPNGTLFDVKFINYQTGFAVGVGGTIMKTINGGNNWSLQSTGGPDPIQSVSFINANTGTVVGWFGTIYHTTNGGANWVRQDCPTNDWLLSVSFTDANNGTIVGWFGTILRTTNGGNPLGIIPQTPQVPDKFHLYQNYPNPFNPTTKIKFSIPEVRSQSAAGGSEVRLEIYDILGNEVATPVDEPLQPGTYEVGWDASNYSSGLYFYMLKAGDFSETKKMLIIK